MANGTLMEILDKVRSGEISVDEAARRLAEIEPNVEPETETTNEVPSRKEPDQTDGLEGLGWWKYAWMIPLWVGIVVLVLSAWLLTWGYTNERFFWFYCSWLPLLLGILITILGVWSRQARWAHVRIHESGGNNISISVPLPIRLASWGLKVFGPRIPNLQEKHLDELPQILDALSNTRDPISVEVDEKDGDRVRVYIQ